MSSGRSTKISGSDLAMENLACSCAVDDGEVARVLDVRAFDVCWYIVVRHETLRLQGDVARVDDRPRVEVTDEAAVRVVLGLLDDLHGHQQRVADDDRAVWIFLNDLCHELVARDQSDTFDCHV